MKYTVTKAYQKDWQKKIIEKGRIKSQNRVYNAFSLLFKEILKDYFKGRILDLGCGDGALVQLLNSKKNIEAKGIDINQGVNFETDKLPFRTDEYDIVIMYSVIEHIVDPGNILREVKRILKPHGKIIIITSNYDLTNLITCDRSFYNDPTHVHPYNFISIDYLMNLYNFKKRFIGLWTIKKTSFLWRLPTKLQFLIGALLPFKGQTKYVIDFLKGRSNTMLCVFENE
ncbi:MAG: class I SAM-dependent methyltransferase [Nanoarchaeota archaeon]|nr:class I SAM-dependent methyltransferase [Nanoarchaeota archaeon]